MGKVHDRKRTPRVHEHCQRRGVERPERRGCRDTIRAELGHVACSSQARRICAGSGAGRHHQQLAQQATKSTAIASSSSKRVHRVQSARGGLVRISFITSRCGRGGSTTIRAWGRGAAGPLAVQMDTGKASPTGTIIRNPGLFAPSGRAGRRFRTGGTFPQAARDRKVGDTISGGVMPDLKPAKRG